MPVCRTDETLHTVVAINDHGLALVRDGAGPWLIGGSADGLVYPAEQRLVWLFPLLEPRAGEVLAAAPELQADRVVLTAVVRCAFTAWSDYWRELALDWLEAGWPVGTVVDAVDRVTDSPRVAPPLRHRALALWRSATRS
jgi:hypothetical protein